MLCFEDKGSSTAQPLVDSYRVCANYCKQTSIGEVLVSSVYERGAIAGNPVLIEPTSSASRYIRDKGDLFARNTCALRLPRQHLPQELERLTNEGLLTA